MVTTIVIAHAFCASPDNRISYRLVLIKKSKVVHLYSALITTFQRRFTMINLPPADWKHIQAQIAAASKQSMHAGTHFTDLGRMES